MNVLSIDWDYFMDCTDTERLDMFPDAGNEDLGLSMSTQIWGYRYAVTRAYKHKYPNAKELTDVSVKRNELDYVIYNILSNLKAGCVFMYADSHEDIYEFVKRNRRGKKKFNIVNVDHHSDCYNIGEDVNCGNWVNRLDDDGVIDTYTWVKGDSRDFIADGTLKCKTYTTQDISTLAKYEWDLVFICRSSIWSPPHLDKEFNDMYAKMNKWLPLNINPKFFINRFDLIEDKINSKAIAHLEVLNNLAKCAEYNAANCDCTEELTKIQEILASRN